MRLSKSHHSTGTRFPGKIFLGFLLVLSLTLVYGAAGKHSIATAQKKPGPYVIKIDNFSFTPMELTVPAGAQVTWINQDDVPHTVVSTERKFKSKALDTDEKFSFTFQEPGTYEYFCSVHPKMTGKIIVK
ncbi:MAG: cupredoxin family copper-binding protein [Candidatus Acidiferrales bacterium]